MPTLIVAADADMAPPSHYVEVFKLLDGGLRDGGWMGEGRPKGGHALAILPGLTHYNLGASPLFAAVTLDFLDGPRQLGGDGPRPRRLRKRVASLGHATTDAPDHPRARGHHGRCLFGRP